jgi:molybdenum cofactor cytidylyltransferase
MIFGNVPVAEAAGGILAHGLLVAGRRWAKGRVLSAADVAALSAAGIAEVTIARLDADDVGEDDAAARLAAAMAGPGCTALPAAHGRANIAATHAGLLQLDAGAVHAANAIDEAITIATLPPLARVAAGAIVATVKLIRYGVAAPALAAAQAALAPLAVAPFRPCRAALIATRLPGSSLKAEEKTIRVTAARIAALGSTLAVQPPCPHDAAALATALAACDAEIILIASASATVDRADVVPAAILAAGGHVERLGMPVDPGNLLCLGHIGARPVIGLPGCARSPRRNGLDDVLERLVAGLPVDSAAIAAMGVGGLLPEAERPQPRAATAAPARVGAVVLAAGASSRMGGPHKLLEEWRGKPLVAHVVDAVLAAGLPALVVLGARADAVRAALAGRAVAFAQADDWAEGLGRSLAAGIAAVPADWEAAIVCLADMPRIEPALLGALAAAPGDVVVPLWQGRRGHPVRWGRTHFAALMALSGDVGGKAVLAGLSPTEIPALSDAVYDDIDTPEALARLRGRPQEDA